MFHVFTREGLISLLYTLPILLISISIHEFSHSFVAYKLGDRSQKYLGNLTLDPFKHIDLLGLLCIVLCGFGWGKPAIINEENFKNKTKGIMLTALAGPVSNLILAILLAIILKVLLVTGLAVPVATSSVGGILFNMLILGIEFNVVFAVFNLIPLPPLDGSKIFLPILPRGAKTWFIENERIFYIIFLVIWISGIAGNMISPLISKMTSAILGIALKIFGLA